MRARGNGIREHLAKEPPEILYHYTSLASFREITKSKSLYATDIFYLNDLLEYRHARQLIANRINERLSDPDEACEEAALRWYFNLLMDEEIDPVYIASFSEKGDDLSQWRGYVPSGQGVCIGFDSNALREAADSIRYDAVPVKRFGALGKVIYISDGEGPSFDDFITAACDYLDVFNGEVVRAVAGEGLVNHGTPFYKHLSFSDEAEWRVSLWTLPQFDFRHDMDFRVGASTLVPFTRLNFKSVATPFLRKVIIGPTPNMNLSLRATNAFLRSEGMENIPVEPSKVPYRSW